MVWSSIVSIRLIFDNKKREVKGVGSFSTFAVSLLSYIKSITKVSAFRILFLSGKAPNEGKETNPAFFSKLTRSEEHTSELQSRFDLVCRLLLEKKKSRL